MALIKLNRGYDVRLEGPPADIVLDGAYPKTVAVQPTDFRGIKPKLLVGEGTEVKAGTPLFHQKNNPGYRFVAPASGRVAEIRRGHRRVIEAIVIETDGKRESEEFRIFSTDEIPALSAERVRTHLLDTGTLSFFRQRPFDVAPSADVLPRDIFISTFDSSPLAPDLTKLLVGNERAFQTGLDVCARLTTGKVYLGLDGSRTDLPGALVKAQNCEINRFTGKHPAGAVGVQIHHVKPISGRNDVVWTISPQQVIQLGKLFTTGRYPAEVMVAVTGESARKPAYVKTYVGAAMADIVGNQHSTQETRWISGSVLTGKNVGQGGFLRLHDHQVTLIPESTSGDFIGWMLPCWDRDSFYRAFLSGMPWMKKARFHTDTKLNGGRRALVASGFYEDVLPMDVYPIYLIKSIMAQDFEEMEGLGIYEMTEEEIALCEYVDPSKTDMQKILREGIELIIKEG